VNAESTLRWRFYGLLALRWLGTGLVIPFFVLIMQERGLALASVASRLVGRTRVMDGHNNRVRWRYVVLAR
jgi:hypothetical protein